LDAALIDQERREAEERLRVAAMHAYLRKSGAGWLVVAALQFVFYSYLSAGWGVVCIGLGALNLAYPRRAMLMTNGVAMILIGIGNFAATLYSGNLGGMTTLGFMQLIWGVRELGRYRTGDVQS
jgi:hypothetical protein